MPFFGFLPGLAANLFANAPDGIHNGLRPPTGAPAGAGPRTLAGGEWSDTRMAYSGAQLSTVVAAVGLSHAAGLGATLQSCNVMRN